MIAIVDYGLGNLASVAKACAFVGYEARVSADAAEIQSASHIILPGVGAARDAMQNLRDRGLLELVQEQARSGKPFLGICLGMQLLFDYSLENGRHECLGLIGGQVEPFHVPNLRVPHIGWNSIETTDESLFGATEQSPYVYFVHSYHAAGVAPEHVIATSVYGYVFCAAVRSGNVFGTQFHPEKSGGVGLDMIKKFGGLS